MILFDAETLTFTDIVRAHIVEFLEFRHSGIVFGSNLAEVVATADLVVCRRILMSVFCRSGLGGLRSGALLRLRFGRFGRLRGHAVSSGLDAVVDLFFLVL